MKSVFCLLSFLFVATPVLAQPSHIMKEGYPVCISESALDQFIKFSVQKDDVAGGEVVDVGVCVASNGGQTVYLEDYQMFSGKVKVRLKGQTRSFWTVNEAVQ